MSGRLVITDRGIRLVQTLVASAVALALLLVTSGVSGPAAPENGWTNLRGFAALDAAPCPSTTSLALPTVSPARIEAARERRFSVFGPRPTELDEPIDWHTDPLGAERYRQNLHKLRFLTPLLSSYAYDDQAADLDQAVAIGLDWVRHNPRGEPGTADEAWSSKVVRADHHRGARRRRRHVLDVRGDPGSPQAHRDGPLGRRLAVRPTPATAEGSERPGSSPCETAPGLDRVPRAPSGRAR
jgi:hypothetical protein